MSAESSSYYPLFEHMSKEHNLTLLDSELEDICQIVMKMLGLQPVNDLHRVVGKHWEEELEHDNAVLRAALQSLYDETADYIRINNLGEIHHNVSMQRAREALEDVAAVKVVPAIKACILEKSLIEILSINLSEEDEEAGLSKFDKAIGIAAKALAKIKEP